MAKQLQNNPISSNDLVEFLDTSSDFAFELRCLELLSTLGFQCQHGGSYLDRVTGKSRQFDIRARNSPMPYNQLHVRWAVECKNLSALFPLMIMCVPRTRAESFHQLIWSYDPDLIEERKASPLGIHTPIAFRKNCDVLPHPSSAYSLGGSVGKSCAQVRRAPDGSIVGNDAEVFERWSQALASAYDLADEAAGYGEEHNEQVLSLILPIVVVPDETLWKVDYSVSGARSAEPTKVDRCSFFVGRDYTVGDRPRQIVLTVSHLEFVTVTGLRDLAMNILGPGDKWFPAFDEQSLGSEGNG